MDVANPTKATAGDHDDEIDLFGSDEEEKNPEAARIHEERLAAYKAKKENKPKPAAKSVVIMDIKPWGRLLSIDDRIGLFQFDSYHIC
jgi:elongation factor 1-beta